MAFRLGLTSDEPLIVLRGVRVREDGASPLLGFTCFAATPLPPPLAPALPAPPGLAIEESACCCCCFGAIPACACARGGGARLLLIPRRPRFMMLAGVTGVSWGLGEGGVCAWSFEVFDVDDPEEEDDDDDDDDNDDGMMGTGGAGGGIERSTGEGVSPGTSPAVLPFRERVDRSRGVELVDLEPRYIFLGWVWLGIVGRMAGDCCFFREGCMLDSSSLVEAWRLLLLVELVELEEVCIDCW
jgi:hypothetical protein